jgi:uncharacterized membrane protein YhhN
VNAVVAVLLALAAIAAVVNWIGVAREDRRLVWIAKPATLALLIAAAVALEPDDPAVRAWFVAGLVLSLAGDVFLMLPEERSYPVEPFLLGLVSFLLGHVTYIVGMAIDHESWALTLLGLVVVAGALAAVAPRILGSVGAEAPEMRLPVVVYMTIISTMVVASFGRAVPVGIAGALLFYASDSILAWNRFVRPSPTLRVMVMVTYHLAQVGLVLSLLG